jgi:ferredoxin-like protein FixX
MHIYVNRFWCDPHSKIYIADDCHGHLFELLLMHNKCCPADFFKQQRMMMILMET